MEIERKYRISELPPNLSNGEEILQGYILANQIIEVRLRKKADKYYLAVKSDGSLKRLEWEIRIFRWIFGMLKFLTHGCRIYKIRYCHKLPTGLLMEFDEYFGKLRGLLILEVEFPDEASANAFTLPESIKGIDVTFDKRYKNKNLALKGLPK